MHHKCLNQLVHIIVGLQFLALISTTVKGDMTNEVDDNEDRSDLFNMHLNVSNIGGMMREMIEHFKMADPVGLPGAPIPDPMPTPDTKYINFPTTLYLKKSKIHGLSQFRIEETLINLYTLEVELLLSYQKLEVLGNYMASSFLSGKSRGGYNVTIVEVSMGGTAKLDTTIQGHLEATNIDMDLIFKDIIMNFENPTFIINLLQGMVNTIGTFVFDQIKPYVLREVNKNIKENMNNVLSTLKNTFPNSISPLDLAVAKGRKFVREEGFDPFPVQDYKYSAGFVAVNVIDIHLSGLASFYRLGNMSVLISKNVVTVDTLISTQQLEGKCSWEVALGSMLSTYGSTSFSVQYVQVHATVNQSLDVRNTPTLEDLDITLGNIQLRMDGLGTFDYVLESVVNILPNIIRKVLVRSLEGVLKQRIQTILSALDVEELLITNVVSKYDPKQELPNELEEDMTETSYEFPEDPLDLQSLYDEIQS